MQSSVWIIAPEAFSKFLLGTRRHFTIRNSRAKNPVAATGGQVRFIPIHQSAKVGVKDQKLSRAAQGHLPGLGTEHQGHPRSRGPIVSLALPGHPTEMGVARKPSEMMTGFVRQRQSQSAFSDCTMSDQPAVQSNVSNGSQHPGLGIQRRGFPDQLVGDLWKGAGKPRQQVHCRATTLSLSPPARKNVLCWPVQKGHATPYVKTGRCRALAAWLRPRR